MADLCPLDSICNGRYRVGTPDAETWSKDKRGGFILANNIFAYAVNPDFTSPDQTAYMQSFEAPNDGMNDNWGAPSIDGSDRLLIGSGRWFIAGTFCMDKTGSGSVRSDPSIHGEKGILTDTGLETILLGRIGDFWRKMYSRIWLDDVEGGAPQNQFRFYAWNGVNDEGDLQYEGSASQTKSAVSGFKIVGVSNAA